MTRPCVAPMRIMQQWWLLVVLLTIWLVLSLLTLVPRDDFPDFQSLAGAFDALLEYKDHKPFECVGEGAEARAAMAVLSDRPEWREDALVARFRTEILPQLQRDDLALEPWLKPGASHLVPQRLLGALDALG